VDARRALATSLLKILSLSNVKYLLSAWPIAADTLVALHERTGLARPVRHLLSRLEGDRRRADHADLRANISQRAVLVPAGAHEVRFELHSATIRAGSWLSGGGLLLLLAAMAPWGRWRDAALELRT
jgi:hypothetical protein